MEDHNPQKATRPHSASSRNYSKATQQYVRGLLIDIFELADIFGYEDEKGKRKTFNRGSFGIHIGERVGGYINENIFSELNRGIAGKKVKKLVAFMQQDTSAQKLMNQIDDPDVRELGIAGAVDRKEAEFRQAEEERARAATADSESPQSEAPPADAASSDHGSGSARQPAAHGSKWRKAVVACVIVVVLAVASTALILFNGDENSSSPGIETTGAEGAVHTGKLGIAETRRQAEIGNEALEAANRYLKKGDYPKAQDYFATAARRGSIIAKAALAKMHFYGQGGPQRQVLALEYARDAKLGGLEQLSSQGNGDATFWLAHLTMYGIGWDEDKERAFALFREAIRQGNSRAYFSSAAIKIYEGDAENCEAVVNDVGKAKQAGHIAAIRLEGQINYDGYCMETPNRQKAVELWKAAAEEGELDAQYYYGRSLEYGEGVDKNIREAAIQYERAAKQGDDWAQYRLGRLYADGLLNVDEEGTDADTKAAYWLRKAADQNLAWAENYLGIMYYEYRLPTPFSKLEDDIVAIDADGSDGLAYKWFKRAADNDFAAGYFNVGLMHDNGRVGRNLADDVRLDQAVDWYRRAEEKDYSKAPLRLGQLYASKKVGGDLDDEARTGKIVGYYEKAAALGNTKAMTELGWIYYNGELVERDFEESAYWFGRAETEGDPNGTAGLGFIFANEDSAQHSLADAASYCQEASRKGDFCGHYCVGIVFFKQDQTAPLIEPQKAERALLDGSQGTNTCSMLLLGLGYELGYFSRGVDLKEAEWWLREAVNLGSRDAMFNLGTFLMRNRGDKLEKGYEAHELIAAAGAGGHKGALCSLLAFEATRPDLRWHELNKATYVIALKEGGDLSDLEAQEALEDPRKFLELDIAPESVDISFAHPEFDRERHVGSLVSTY